MRRFLAPIALLLLGTVAPASTDSTQKGGRLDNVQADGDLLTYQSRQGESLGRIRTQWLLPMADLRRMQMLNNISNSNTVLPEGTSIRIPENWVKTLPVQAQLVAFRGDVRVIRNGEVRLAEKAMQLFEGDEIETGRNAFVTMKLPDASRVSLPSASRVTVERLREVPMLDSLDRQFRLVHGRSEMQVTPMANPASRFLITTPVAVAAVRGTEYRVSYTPAEMRAVTEVTEGRVAVQSADGSAEVLLEAGTAAIVAATTGMRGPLPLPGKPLVALRTRAQTGRQLLFRIRPASGMASYQIELATDAGFTERVASAESETGTLSFDSIANGHYYARAYLVDANGLRGLPTVFEFDRQYAPGNASRNDEIRLGSAMAAIFSDADGGWVAPDPDAGLGDSAIAFDASIPVVSAGDATRLVDSSGSSAAQALSFDVGQSFARQTGNNGIGGGIGGGGGFFSIKDGDGNPKSPGDLFPADSIPSRGIDPIVSAIVPEPRIWLLFLTGFGLVGWTVRLRRRFA